MAVREDARVVPTALRERAPAPPPRRRRRWILPTYTALVIAYLFIPVAVMILFGFNDPAGRFNYTWQGFTFKWYDPDRLFGIPELTVAIRNSLVIAALNAFIATVLGTLAALALSRYAFRGRSAANLSVFVPMATPEIVMGVSLLALFVTLNVTRGIPTILIGHIVFSISFVVVTVKARTASLDRNLEDAAQDLGADPWMTFWTVTFPLIFPGILAAGLLAFVLSIDDYVVTSFIAGADTTLPLWIFGASRIGVPPQVNVMGTLIFSIGVVYVVVSIIRGWRQGRIPPPVLTKG